MGSRGNIEEAGSGTSTSHREADQIILENEWIRVALDRTTGCISSLFNKPSALEAIDPSAVEGTPWRIQTASIDPQVFDRRPSLKGAVTGKTELVLYFLKEIVGGVWSSDFDQFAYRLDEAYADGTAYVLTWTRSDGITVESRVQLDDGSPDVQFEVKVVNPTTVTILAIEYPIIDAVRPLGEDSSDNRLAHSVDGGFIFKDPHRLFQDEEILDAWRRRKVIATTSPVGHPDEGRGHGGLFRVRGYPNGFEGAPMQFWAFYKHNVGGFYFASHDPFNTEKMFHFFSTEGRDVLTTSIVHMAWDWEPGDMELGYPVIVGSLTTGQWFEAAERYRAWATGTGPDNPAWCSRGTLRDRVAAGDASRWLVEEVGFNTFGLPSSIDVSQWLDAFHAITDQPVMHILGHDWEGGAELIAPEKWEKSRDLLSITSPNPSLHAIAEILNLPADSAHESRLREALVKLRQDLWSSIMLEPMKFMPPRFDERNVETIRANGDFIVPFLWRDFIGFGHDVEKYGCHAPVTPFTDAFMCPSTDYWRTWHFQTDAELVDMGVDSIYYDVSASCATPTLCTNRLHDHPIGYGRHMIEGYASVFRDSKSSFGNGAKYVPTGTEVIIENLIDVVDYAQCRAGAGVQGTMEGEEFVEWQKDRRAVKIPMWAYVYHEYGPVLLDGWAKISDRFGEIFYEIAARVALEGGLLQLNYEFSPIELFAGMTGPSYQLAYFNRASEVVEADPVDEQKLDFIREISVARTGFGKEYLAYGKMIPSTPILTDVPEIDLDWDHFNSVHRMRLESGVYTTSSVIQAAWSSHDGTLGYFFVNLQPDTPLVIEVAPIEDTVLSAEIVTSSGRSDLGAFDALSPIAVTLEPRRITLLEIIRDRPG